MSKKHYEAIAVKVKESDTFANEYCRATFASELAEVFSADNPSFRRELFMQACRPSWIIGTTKEVVWDRAIAKGEK